MIRQSARILSTDQGRARVRVGGQSGCNACDAGQGCGAGLFGRLLRRRPSDVEVPNPDELAAGRAVILGIDESVYLRLVVGLYGWPLVAGLLGAFLAHTGAAAWWPASAWQSDLLAAIGGLAAGGASLALTHRQLPRTFTHCSLRILDTGLDCGISGRH